ATIWRGSFSGVSWGGSPSFACQWRRSSRTCATSPCQQPRIHTTYWSQERSRYGLEESPPFRLPRHLLAEHLGASQTGENRAHQPLGTPIDGDRRSSSLYAVIDCRLSRRIGRRRRDR